MMLLHIHLHVCVAYIVYLSPLLHDINSVHCTCLSVFIMSIIIYVGVGFCGQARILIAKHKPTDFFNTVRHINLELLTSEQLEEVQHEMKLSQLLHHHNVACYLTSFVVGVHLWAIQPLMHYGELVVQSTVNLEMLIVRSSLAIRNTAVSDWKGSSMSGCFFVGDLCNIFPDWCI